MNIKRQKRTFSNTKVHKNYQSSFSDNNISGLRKILQTVFERESKKKKNGKSSTLFLLIEKSVNHVSILIMHSEELKED